ncbi:hypothetical protein EIP91_008529 [Steccherinum ochraceum]|uniref:Transmembrane protein n=1 Tax=Steccherinum ochraceum TaxID=92696 RepID=A0A4R0R2R9_9APHY|nr:hypothetical protein EIP91_008529 [Steccherinum ochraceum]
MLATTAALLSLATAEWLLDVIRLVQGVVVVGPRLSSGIDGYFADASRISWMMKGILYSCQTLILDAVVIYRAYVVWQNFYVVIAPILGWLGLLATSIGSVVALRQTNQDEATMEGLHAAEARRWAGAIYGTTFATNLLATALLAFRIWRTNKLADEFMPSETSSGLKIVLRVVIESGAIYSLMIITALITFIIGSPAIWIIVDMSSPIICIVFNMIIVRVGFAADRKSTDIEGTYTYRPTGLRISQRSYYSTESTEPSSGLRSGFDTSSIGEGKFLSQKIMQEVDDAEFKGLDSSSKAGVSLGDLQPYPPLA